MTALRARRTEEARRGQTLVGPHRDDRVRGARRPRHAHLRLAGPAAPARPRASPRRGRAGGARGRLEPRAAAGRRALRAGSRRPGQCPAPRRGRRAGVPDHRGGDDARAARGLVAGPRGRACVEPSRWPCRERHERRDLHRQRHQGPGGARGGAEAARDVHRRHRRLRPPPPRATRSWTIPSTRRSPATATASRSSSTPTAPARWATTGAAFPSTPTRRAASRRRRSS